MERHVGRGLGLSSREARILGVAALAIALATPGSAGQVPIVVQTNALVRVATADLAGAGQVYGQPAIRLMQGLKPDIVAIQEFRYRSNSPADLREFVDLAFGPDFEFYREPDHDPGLPTGVISRYPILEAGSWPSGLADRGTAWARLDVPGPRDLYLVSAHFAAGVFGADARYVQALDLRGRIQSLFPSDALVLIGGNLNLQNWNEDALRVLTAIVIDEPAPTDRPFRGNSNTDVSREYPFDHLLPTPSLWALRESTVLGDRFFADGLVFDSRVFSPLAAVSPIEFNDSANAQHMAVVKDFKFPYAATNWMDVPSPVLAIEPTGVIRWDGVAGIDYTVEGSPNFTGWDVLATVTSTSTHFAYTNAPTSATLRFIRVRVP